MFDVEQRMAITKEELIAVSMHIRHLELGGDVDDLRNFSNIVVSFFLFCEQEITRIRSNLTYFSLYRILFFLFEQMYFCLYLFRH